MNGYKRCRVRLGWEGGHWSRMVSMGSWCGVIRRKCSRWRPVTSSIKRKRRRRRAKKTLPQWLGAFIFSRQGNSGDGLDIFNSFKLR